MREIFLNPFPCSCYACYEQRETPRHPFIHRHCRVATIFLKSTSNRLFFVVATRYYKIHSATSFLAWNPLYIGILAIVACSRKVYRHFFSFSPHIGFYFIGWLHSLWRFILTSHQLVLVLTSIFLQLAYPFLHISYPAFAFLTFCITNLPV